ncbi:hypothetical protein [Reinekea thalattae]|uniref:Uncharacterized protein n=1 Tax=Reinekea thalattae TaxID=2593301 RepID=A0A5C8Z6Z0_9GAMM|nr:hypothetical protein [Reinekea thalattae]TXR53865.1 hypothetical protein FME95_04725 [Reinekea thalattae]
MKYLLLIILVFSVAAAHAEKWYEGSWVVSDAKFPGISTVGMEDITPLIGTSGVISSSTVTLRESLCTNPVFRESTIDKKDFEFSYRATFKELGFSRGPVSAITISCNNKVEYIYSHLIQNNNVTYGVWKGAFVLLVESKP